MHWIYILECEDNHLYVGETTRLYRRFWEHWGGEGGVNTRVYKPIRIAAIYKVQTIGKFENYDYDTDWAVNNDPKNERGKYNKWKMVKFEDDKEGEYDNLGAENNITECLMLSFGETKHIRGGKYTRIDNQYKLPSNELFKRLPFCECGYPCDVKKCKDKDALYFRCARKNMWEDFRTSFDCSGEPCKFYQEYNHDEKLRRIYFWKPRSSIARRLLSDDSGDVV
jgi:GIY-YIG catalytic domain